MDYLVFWEMSRCITSIVFIFFVLTWCFRYRVHRNSTNGRRTTKGSHIWSRRKVFWRQARVSRATFISHALKSRYYDNYRFSNMQRNDYYSLDQPQQGEDPKYQDINQAFSSYKSFTAFRSFGFTVPVVLFLLSAVFTFGMLGLYKEEKGLGFTLSEFEN